MMARKVQRPSQTIENYLGVIYTLSRDGETVIGRKLADWLEVSPPTVTATLQRMIRDGWVTMSDDKSIRLTQGGREAATSVIRRHMLTELLLARILGVPWSKVHEEADRMAHGVSAEIADRVANAVKHPRVCPHGNPMPGHEEITEPLVPLLEAEPGAEYVLARIHEELERNPDLMAYLERHCLLPGATIVLVEIMDYNDTVTVHCGGHDVVLGLSVAGKVWVRDKGSPMGQGAVGPGVTGDVQPRLRAQ
ncbi:MAG: metal-dependent transcriptional regulator [Anaerolineales bacterium]|nr:MAG: metal-dependent transcriptional regulator [Anaerolineales bacterium]